MRNLYYYESSGYLNDAKLMKKRALLMSESEWIKLNGNMTKGQRKLEEAERKRLEDEKVRNLSIEMAKTWDNTVMNIRRRRFEARKEKAEKLEAHRRRRYLQARKEEEDLKKKVKHDAKESKRMETDSFKSLTSALRFSEVLRERSEQIKFQAKLKEIEDDRQREYEWKILKDVKEYNKEVEEEKERTMEKKRMLREQARKDFLKAFEAKTKANEERLKLERIDIDNIEKEIETEKENARKELERKRKIVMDDVNNNRKMIEEFTKKKNLEDEEEEQAVKIHATAKRKIALIRKLKEIEMRSKLQEKQEKISLAVAAEVADRSAKEDAMLQKAIAEKEALEERDKKNKKEYQERLIKELKDERKAFLEKEEERKFKESEEFKWNLMQRMKSVEENEKFHLNKKLEAELKKEELRKTWNTQVEEKREVEAKEQAEIIHQHATEWDEHNKDFLEFAEIVLNDCKKKGRPLFPVNKYIEEYKKAHNIGKPPFQHKIWKSNVPIDSCMKQTQTSPKIAAPIVKPEQKEKLSVGRTRTPTKPWPSQNEICREESTGLN